MGAFEDYVNGLDSQENVDPIEVARQLSELHTHEVQTREAKISELGATVTEKDAAVAAKDTEIARWKSMNFDLSMQIPGSNSNNDNSDDNEKPAGSTIIIGDLFNPSVRKRHGI